MSSFCGIDVVLLDRVIGRHHTRLAVLMVDPDMVAHRDAERLQRLLGPSVRSAFEASKGPRRGIHSLRSRLQRSPRSLLPDVVASATTRDPPGTESCIASL